MGNENKHHLELSAPENMPDKNALPSMSAADDDDAGEDELDQIAQEMETLRESIKNGTIEPNVAYQQQMALNTRYEALTNPQYDASRNQKTSLAIGPVHYDRTTTVTPSTEVGSNAKVTNTHKMAISLKDQFYVAASGESTESASARVQEIIKNELTAPIKTAAFNATSDAVENATGSKLAGAIAGLGATVLTTAAVNNTIPDVDSSGPKQGTTYGITVGMRF